MIKPEDDIPDEELEVDYEQKRAAMEKILGPMHNLVQHAIVPFDAGGSVDLYYFLHTMPGTCFTTMEVMNPFGPDVLPSRIGRYELVAFTKHPYQPHNNARSEINPFGKINDRITHIFTMIGNYSRHAVLNPFETCEIPTVPPEPNWCLIFDEYRRDNIDFVIRGEKCGLLLIIEILRREMAFAMEHGGAVLIEKLKKCGYYPYSDLDRDMVV
jgi:hypothetical protein